MPREDETTPASVVVEVSHDAGLAAALSAVLARDARSGEVRAYAERYGWDEPVQELVNLFLAAGKEAR